MDSKETLSFVAKLLLIWTLLAFILAFIAPVLSVVLFLFLFVLGIPALMIAMWGRSKQLRQQQSEPYWYPLSCETACMASRRRALCGMRF